MWVNRKSVDKDYETASAVRFQHRFKPMLLHNYLLAWSLPKNVLEMSRSTNGDQLEVLKELLAMAMPAQEGCQCCCVPDLLSEGAHNTEKGEYHIRSSQPLGVLEGFDVPVK